MRILCVAEKPSIAKSVANTLGGGRVTVRNTGNQYIKNYDFTYRFPAPIGDCEVTMTSVVGHLTTADFSAEYRSWQSCEPEQLFRLPIQVAVAEDKATVARNIREEARRAGMLLVWTDCDREGEHIGVEVVNVALNENSRLTVKRAMFNNLEAQHIHQAARTPRNIDYRLSDAVDARIEIDLRLGAAFTRFQTLSLRNSSRHLGDALISYGSCQFPTLGFVVDRFKRVQNFKPEKFWYIQLLVSKTQIEVNFKWKRVHLFDRMVVTLLFQWCLEMSSGEGRIVSVVKKPTSKWRPLPLTTVELQRRGSLFLGMSAKKVMDIAEKLYTKGFISYPRTETDQFAVEMDLRALIQKQTGDTQWGGFANNLMNGGYRAPRRGTHDDHAHPPIHPVAHVSEPAVDRDEKRVYELVTRHFLACCADDAKGESTEVVLDWGGERFSTSGLRVVERNYLDVYPYDRWQTTQALPEFIQGEAMPIKRATIEEGTTTAPGYLTEPELIQLMDANGIGTDATMAEHIETVLKRQYVVKMPAGAPGRFPNPAPYDAPERPAAGGGRAGARGGAQRGAARGGRGRGGRGAARGGRGGRGGNANAIGGRGGEGKQELIPTTLGVALVEGYDEIGIDQSLAKPFLRKDMEAMMRDICEGRRTKQQVVEQSLAMYLAVFRRANLEQRLLQKACRHYLERQ
ncbi:DNA topoisomerase [Limtongia smithiae]|uniref:DNA topoisomerase n=1 Tax=Limtongia smithiae TaxID=1125753 RepID=UPI0034CD814F